MILGQPNPRTVMLIDGANLWLAVRQLGFNMDYKLLLDWAREKNDLIRPYWFTAIPTGEREYESIIPLIDWNEYNGYTIVSKDMKEFTDAEGRVKRKGNMDVEIAVTAFKMAQNPTLTHMILVTGDGDFCSLVDAMQDKGIRVTVLSTIKTQPPMCADLLRRQADVFVDLVDIQDRVTRQGEAPNVRRLPTERSQRTRP